MRNISKMQFSTEKFKDVFGENLRTIIRDKGLTIEEFAEMMDVSVRVVYDWCNGIKSPKFERAIAIALVLEVSLDSLVF